MTQLTCRLTAKHRDQLRNPTLGNRVWATFYAALPASYECVTERQSRVAKDDTYCFELVTFILTFFIIQTKYETLKTQKRLFKHLYAMNLHLVEIASRFRLFHG